MAAAPHARRVQAPLAGASAPAVTAAGSAFSVPGASLSVPPPDTRNKNRIFNFLIIRSSARFDAEVVNERRGGHGPYGRTHRRSQLHRRTCAQRVVQCRRRRAGAFRQSSLATGGQELAKTRKTSPATPLGTTDEHGRTVGMPGLGAQLPSGLQCASPPPSLLLLSCSLGLALAGV